MTKSTVMLTCVLLFASSAGAYADPAQSAARAGDAREKLAQRFAQADTDHDGRLSLAEAKAGMPMVAQHFDEIDHAHAGFVSADQIREFMRTRMAQKSSAK